MSLNHTDEKLVRMANQIATFFLSQPEEVRVDGVATHINKFWEPRMRRRFFEMIDQDIGPSSLPVYGGDGNMGNALVENFEAGR